MCSLQPAGDPVKDPPDTTSPADRLCVKCKHAPATVSIRFAVYCDACFLEQTVHKYRLNVAKSRRRAERENILLFMDLDDKAIASYALLMLTTQAMAEDAARVQHVDRFFVASFREDQTVSDVCSAFNIQVHVVPTPEHCTTIEHYKCTAADDLIIAGKARAVATVARTLNCDKVYFPDSCNDLAASVFKLMIKGAGEVVPWEMQIVKSLFAMNIVKPLRDHTRVELAEILKLRGVAVKDSHGAGFGLNHLTERFLAALDKDYSATASTVARTAGKVSSAWCEHAELYRPCAFCGQPTSAAASSPEPACLPCSTSLSELAMLGYNKD